MNRWSIFGRPPVASGSVLAYLTVDEEEYAEAFRAAGWSEHAVQMELDLLRTLIAQHQDLLPSTAEGEPTDDDFDFAAALERSRLRRSEQ